MRQFTLLTITILLLAACAPVTTPPVATPLVATPPAQAELIQAGLPRLAEPQVDEAQLEQLVQGNNNFAFDLYHAIREKSADNLIYSPYSISLAFSMVYAGARGQTEAEMAQVLHFLPQDEHHPAFNALDQYLASLAEDGDGEDGRFQLNIANAVWGRVGLPFEDAYLATLAQQYGAGLRASDFVEQPEEVRQEINHWVAEQTAGRIQNILPPGAIDPDTRLALVNAIYFNAVWQAPFRASDTKDGDFTLLNGNQVTVPLMQHDATIGASYSEGPTYQVVALPYTKEGVEMIIILPRAGQFKDVEADLSADFLNEARARAQRQSVQLTMPRFEFNADLNLKALLTEMNLRSPFSGTADFSGIAEGGGFFISDARHRGTIAVDEEGTEAAATTFFVLAETAWPELPEVTMDRPFIFAIVEQDTGAILFLGRVMNPAASN